MSSCKFQISVIFDNSFAPGENVQTIEQCSNNDIFIPQIVDDYVFRFGCVRDALTLSCALHFFEQSKLWQILFPS